MKFPQAFDVVALAAQVNVQFNNLNNNINGQFNNTTNRLNNIDQQLSMLTAQIMNVRILSSNRILLGGVGLQPLVKDVSGNLQELISSQPDVRCWSPFCQVPSFSLLLAIQVNPPGHQLPQQLA